MSGVKKWGPCLGFDGQELFKPMNWHGNRMIAVNLKYEMFDGDVSFKWIDRIWKVMLNCPQHTFQVLTKHPERMMQFLEGQPVLPNVWLGVVAETQEWLLARWGILQQIPAAVRWLSLEPLLGPNDLSAISAWDELPPIDSTVERISKSTVPGLHWIVLTGQTGPDARPLKPEWVRKIRDDCQKYNILFTFSGWGQWGPVDHKTFSFSGATWEQVDLQTFMVRFDDAADAGRELDGRTWDESPEEVNVK